MSSTSYKSQNWRINQYLALQLNCSRRQADELVLSGNVEVNGQLAQPHVRVSQDDNVRIFRGDTWQTLGKQTATQSVLMYKPIFTLVSRKAEPGKKTIYDILPKKYQHLKPAGRLDYMSEGLLLLSNDGSLLDELMHPKYESGKVYLVGTSKAFAQKTLDVFRTGMELEGYILNSVNVTLLQDQQLEEYAYLKLDTKLYWYSFELSEGRNNQIRKMCAYFGHTVTRLIRVQQGTYKISSELYQKKVLEVS